MIELDRLSLQAGEFSLKEISFQVPTSQHALLMARTGSGKTCLLETICGLRAPTGGKILIHGRDVTTLPPAARDIGYVPQDGAIFTTMRVRDQLGFGLDVRGERSSKIKKRVDEVAELLGITKLLKRYAVGLSGGERQRIALGRAISFRPSVLCLDEPLSSLDESTRDEMIEVLGLVREHTQATILHVSHSSYEAAKLADLTLLIREGQVIESSILDADADASGQHNETRHEDHG